MSVRFKFKNDLDYQPIPCDGYHISVRDLKKSIVRRKKLGKVTDFDLVVTNSQTNHVYDVDDELIAKNTTLVVQRAPLADGKKKVWEAETGPADQTEQVSGSTANTYSGIPSLNLTQSLGDTEEDKISKMMSNSSEMYSEKHWTRYRGQKALPEGAKPPPHWKCSKCLGNHWVTDCPFANNDLKRTTGIPRSFLKPADSNVPGAKINPQGLIVVNEMEKLAYSEKKIEKNPWLIEDDKPAVPKVDIPSELLCPICQELLTDAVMMPCCAGSACDECARNEIIENEGGKCTVCGEVANPEELIPYRLFREKVDKFRNQTGYTKPSSQSSSHPPPAPSVPLKPSLPDIVLPDPTDNNFKFDALVGHRAAPGLKVEPPNLHLSSEREERAASSTPTGTPTQDSPPRRPHTPTSTPPRSPSTPRSRSSSESRSRGTSNTSTGDRRSPPPLAPVSLPPMLDMTIPPPNLTLLPPVHVLSQPQPTPAPHYPPPPHAVAPPHYHHPPPPAPLINPAEDPLAAFEAAMRKLDSKKAARGRSPPRAYQGRSRSRERYRDYYDRNRDRDRDYSPKRRSPGYYSPPRRAPPRRSPSPGGKGGASRRRFVHDIPPETELEKRERERYEREFVERERRKVDVPEGTSHKHRVAPTPPREFLERGVKHENNNDNNRTPSLSPEPNGEQYKEQAPKSSDVETEGHPKLPIIRDERDLDCNEEKESSTMKDKVREDEEDVSSRDREERRTRREEAGQYRRSRERDSRQVERRDERNRYYRDSSRDRDRDRERERGRYERRDRSPYDKNRERSRERKKDSSRERLRPDRDNKERDLDRSVENEKTKERDREDKENISLDNGHSDHSEEEQDTRKSKKSKKRKKSKKNKKKGRESESEGEEEEKVSKKKKKKDRKKKDSDSEVDYEEEKEKEKADNEIGSGDDESPQASELSKQADNSKFINSFSEATVQENKNKLSLPTLVFNDKTEELAPKESKDEALDDELDKDDSFETQLSKWEEDELNLEAQQIREEKPKSSRADSGPSTVLRKALSNMEKDNLKRDDQKRKSKSIEDEDELRNGEENHSRKNKSKKKKKKGLESMKIPEKTLKKLLKKNLLKKKALENLLKDGSKKKKKKRNKSGDQSDFDNSEDETVDRIVRRVKSISQEKKSSSGKKHKRADSEDEREVKSSREGNLQIRVENSSSASEGPRPSKSLANTVQENLMKISRGQSSDRKSPARKSIRDRLGPVGGGSPAQRETLKDRLGKKDTGRKSKEKESSRDGNLTSLPADLKAWAARKASSPSPVRRKARRSRTREKVVAPRNRSRSRERERRRRSRSADVKRRKRSRSSDRSRNGEKRDDVKSNQIKKRKNQRLASDKDRRHNSDSE